MTTSFGVLCLRAEPFADNYPAEGTPACQRLFMGRHDGSVARRDPPSRNEIRKTRFALQGMRISRESGARESGHVISGRLMSKGFLGSQVPSGLPGGDIWARLISGSPTGFFYSIFTASLDRRPHSGNRMGNIWARLISGPTMNYQSNIRLPWIGSSSRETGGKRVCLISGPETNFEGGQ